MHIELGYSLTVDDLHEFQRAHPKIVKALPPVKGQARGSRAMVGWVVIIMVMILIFVVFHNDPARAPAPAAPAPVAHAPAKTPLSFLLDLLPYLFIFVLVWFFFLRARYSKSAARRTLEKNPQIADRQRITLADGGMSTQGPTASSFMVWTHFIHFAETENLFVLLITRQLAHILPKRHFPSPEAMNEFRGFAQAHVGNTPIGFPVLPAQNAETGGGSADVMPVKDSN